MAEQILHGSNVVTAAECVVANEWQRCGVAGFDARLFYGTSKRAERSGHT